jgi:deoxycytidine triphosphate deaminase
MLFISGGKLKKGVWDSVFEGQGRLGLFIMGVNSIKIEQNSPIGQFMFFRSSGAERGFQFNEFYHE